MVSNAQTSFRGQSTVEYLVIVGIIVVLSLIVVAIVLQASGSSAFSSEGVSKLGSTSTADISIVDSVIDSQGDSIIRLQNNSGDSLTITKISSRGNENSFGVNIPLGGDKLFSLSDLNLSCPCGVGQKSVSCTFQIQYTTPDNLLKSSSVTINSSCVDDALPNNPNLVAGLGSGTLADPWIINSCRELQKIKDNLDGNYALGGDINCAETRNWNLGAGFEKIGTCGSGNECSNGNYIYSYRGNFNGNNFSIKNLYINRPTTNTIGLFGTISNTAVVQNFGLVDSNIIGYDYVGSIVGACYGTIRNAYSTGTLRGYDAVGGIAGYAKQALMYRVFNTANVTADGYVGGIIGYSDDDSTIINSYNSGTISGRGIIGGIVGWNVSTGYILNSFNSGLINAGDFVGVGGICGYNSNSSVLINTYNLGNVNGKNYVGGICGWNTNAALISNSYNAGDVNGRDGTATGGIVGVNNTGGLAGYLPSTIKNSFSVGKVYGASDTRGGVSQNSDGSPVVISFIRNMYWYDQPGDNATACYPSGDANCIKASNVSNFYSKTYDVYDSNLPYWDDGNWVWRDNNYPIFSWQ